MERQHLSAAGATLDFKQPASEELPDTFPRGRRCSSPGCITVLSIYNAGPECHAHADVEEFEPTIEQVMKAVPEPADRVAVPAETRTCRDCGNPFEKPNRRGVWPERCIGCKRHHRRLARERSVERRQAA